MTGAEFHIAILALRAWKDGYADGENAMLAIAHVFKARERAGWFGGNWSQILSHHADVSYRKDPPTDDLPDPRNFQIQRLLQEIPGIYSGFTENTITVAQDSIFKYARPGGSPYQISVAPSPPVPLYYGRLDDIQNPFFLEEICRRPEKHSRCATVGGLTFFT